MRTIKRTIVGAFIFSSDGYLLLGKSHKGGVYQDTWVVPGGGVEPGETLLQAVQREIEEEVGIDISQFEIIQHADTKQGTSTKILKETQEEVLVDMTFHDFTVKTALPAVELPPTCNDDIMLAQWHDITTLPKLKVTDPMRATLLEFGYLG